MNCGSRVVAVSSKGGSSLRFKAPKIIELISLSTRQYFPTDVLQRSHPIPIGCKAVETQAHAFDRGSTQVELLFRRGNRTNRTLRFDQARDPDHSRQSNENRKQEQRIDSGQAAFHLKLRLLKIKVAAANTTVT